MAICSVGAWDTVSNMLSMADVVARTSINGGYDGVDLYDAHSSRIIHNVFAHGSCSPNGASSRGGKVALGGKSSQSDGSGMLIRDNIYTSITNGNGGLSATYTEDHNLYRSAGGGPGDSRGTPTYVGGANPTTFAGFHWPQARQAPVPPRMQRTPGSRSPPAD